MTTYRFGILAVAVILGQSRTVQAQFAPGNLVVLRSGDGVGTLGTTGTPVFLEQFSTTGTGQTANFSFTMPTSGATRLTQSGSATSEGQITFSSPTSSITVVGYDAVVGATNVSGSTSATNNRVVNVVDLTANGGSGLETRFGTTATNFSGVSVRSGYSNGTNAWVAGANTGVVTYPGDTVVSNTLTNIRVVNSFNGNLYFSTGSGTRGIYQVGASGLPTGSGTTSTNLITTGTTTSSPYAFSISPDGLTVYIADDSTVANGGGIQKWTSATGAAGSFTLAGTFNALSSTNGARGLAVDFSGANPILYATTNDSRLVTLTDMGVFNSTATILATAPANTAFRSVIFYSPVPEPASVLAIAAGAVGLGGYVRRRVQRGVAVQGA